MKIFDWNNFFTNSSDLECNQINDTKAKLEELKNEFAEIFKENPQSKVKGKLAHLVLKKDAVPKFLPKAFLYQKTESEHLNRLKAVFKRLHDNDVHIKPEN